MNSNEIKYLKALNRKKNRKINNKIVIEGYRIVKDALRYKVPIKKIWITNAFHDNNQDIVIMFGNIEYELVTNKDLSRICDSKSPQQIVALLPIEYKSWEKKNLQGNALILDGIGDPGNLGTILRVAEWYGVSTVLVSDSSVDIYNPKVVRSAMGAHFLMPNIFQVDLNAPISEMKDKKYVILGSSTDGLGHNEVDIGGDVNWALILGNEADGISSEVMQCIDKLISIPKIGNMDSLNVAMAGSILMDRLIIK